MLGSKPVSVFDARKTTPPVFPLPAAVLFGSIKTVAGETAFTAVAEYLGSLPSSVYLIDSPAFPVLMTVENGFVKKPLFTEIVGAAVSGSFFMVSNFASR